MIIMLVKKYGLDIFVDVDSKGYLTKEAGEDFEGVFYDDANEISLNKLKEKKSFTKIHAN